MRSPIRPLGAGLFIALSACNAMALGFGRDSVASNLGQPLSFTVPLRFDADEFVSSECVLVDVVAGENRISASNVRVTMERPATGGDPVVHVTTATMIGEPIVELTIGVGCPIRLSRKFVAFIDPPQVRLAQAAEPAAPAAASAPPTAASAPQPVAASPAPAASSPPQSAEKAAPAPRRQRPRSAVVRAPANRPAAAAPQVARPASEVAPRTAAAAPAPSGTSRLQLESSELLARAPTPPSAASAASAAAPAASAAAAAESPASAASGAGVDPASVARQAAEALAATLPPGEAAAQAQAAREQERIRLLEASLARLSEDSKATQDNIATLQARLREAEAGRYSNPLVYALAAAVALLLLAVATLIGWMRSRERRREAWWAASVEEGAQRPRPAASSEPTAAVVAPVVRSRVEPVPQRAPAQAPVVDPTAPETTAPKGPVTWKPTAAIPELDTRDVPRRAVSAEELIDLEQQAEFFVTLGQDDSAIALLESHIGSAVGASPMPYLKLLDIHRRRGDAHAYEGVRQQFNQRFNGYAAAWDAPPAASLPLEEREDVMARLREAWPTPPRATGLLEEMLFRPTPGVEPFDLDAYRDVLFLYELSRDRVDHEASHSTVDLELPIGPDFAPGELVMHPLRATMPVAPDPSVSKPLDVDLELDVVLADDLREPEAASERSSGFSSLDSPAPNDPTKRRN